MLALSLFGPFRVAIKDQQVETFRTRKVQALLAYLAVEQTDGSGRREKLMYLLWPGLPQKSAQVNLRQILYQLRKLVPAVQTAGGDPAVNFALSDRKRVWINSHYPIQVDVIAFSSLLESTREHDHLDLLLCAECGERMREAAALYRGDFLEDFYLEDSSEFEDWAVVHRENYRRQALDTLETLAEMHIRQSNYPQARKYAERQLEIDNLRESAYRQIMVVSALSGRRSDALGAYETCRRLLAEELGMAPAARTTEIYEQILSGDLDFSEPRPSGVRGYELKEKIGAGSFGTVHRAIQLSIGRQVAIKVIRSEFANDPEFIRRFEAEAQTIARLEHPHIAPLYDYWREPDRAFLSMRYFPGGSLEDALLEGPLSLARAARMVEQIALALAAAHNRGIVHRDLKPANILLDESGNAYLSDFGIAIDRTRSSGLGARKSHTQNTEYISPEQILNEPLSPLTDIYCLGLVIFEALAGEKPYGRSSQTGLIKRQLEDPLPPVASFRPELPPSLDGVLKRAASKAPAERFPNVIAFASAFVQAVEGQAAEQDLPVRVPTAGVQVANPYKGLRPFREEDAGDFYGRRSLVERLIGRLAEDRFLALVGPSGSGKSSAVLAGVIPALRAGAVRGSESWYIAQMTPGAHPFESLEQALLPVAVHPPPSLVEPMLNSEEGLLRTVQRILPESEAQLLLVIDQFEELYTLTHDENLRQHFINSLLMAIEYLGGPLRVLVTLRADFYDRPLENLGLGELLRRQTEVILQFSPEELENAVRGPAAAAGVSLEEGLLATIAGEFHDQPGGLPLLQYALTELFESRQNGSMTLQAYQEIGGIAGALGRRAESLYGRLDEGGKACARQTFLRLVTLGEGAEDTRRRVLRAELESLGDDLEGRRQDWTGLVDHVLDLFGRHRLLTFDRDPSNRAPTVEVAHEALLREWPRLRTWLDEGREDVRQQRLLAGYSAEWIAAGRGSGFLLRGSRLDQLEVWARDTRIALTGDERAILEGSLAARRSRQVEEATRQEHERALERRSRNVLRWLVAVFALAAVVSLFFANFAFGQQRIASEEAMGRATQQSLVQAQAALAEVSAAEALAQKAIAEEQRSLAQEQADSRATQQVIAEEQQAVAEEQARLATSRELVASSISNLEIDPELSMLLALQSLDIISNAQAESVLRQGLDRHRVRSTILGPVGNGGTIGYSPDGERIVTAGVGGNVRVWEATTGKEVFSLTGHTGWVARAFFSPDGKLVGTASIDNTARVWDAATGEQIYVFTEHTDWVFGLAFSPDSTKIATASIDQTVKVWNVENGEIIFTLEGHTTDIFDVAFSPDGKMIATGGEETTRIWDANSGQELLVLETRTLDLEFSPDSARLATKDNTIVTIWDLSNPGEEGYGQQLLTIDGAFGDFATTIGYWSNEKLVANGADHSVIVWDPNTGDELDRFRCHSGSYEMALNVNVDQIAVVGSTGLTKICNLKTNPEIFAFNDWGYGVAFNSDGTRFYTAARNDGVSVWDIKDPQSLDFGRLLWHLETEEGDRFYDSVMDQGETHLAISSLSGTVNIWDPNSWVRLSILNGHTEYITDLGINSQGTNLVTGSGDTTVRIWDTLTGQTQFVLSNHNEPINSVVYSPDGDYIVSSSQDLKIIVWDALTGSLLTYIENASVIWDLAFSPDGRMLATAGDEGVVRIWDFHSILETGEPAELQLLPGHKATINEVTFSQDGTLVAAASSDNTAKVWVVETGEELLTITNHSDIVRDVDFSPDGKWLATASFDRTIRLHLLHLEDLVDLARSRLTRWWTPEECQTYLHTDICPPPP